MPLTEESEIAIRQNLAEYFRQRWPVTHELVEICRSDNPKPHIYYKSLIGANGIDFTDFDPANTPADRIERDEFGELAFPESTPSAMDYFEQNIHRFYKERQPARQHMRTACKDYPTVCSWFGQRWDDTGHFFELFDSNDRTVCNLWCGFYGDDLPKIEQFLQKYEERCLAEIRDAMRILPLPISQAILEHI